MASSVATDRPAVGTTGESGESVEPDDATEPNRHDMVADSGPSPSGPVTSHDSRTPSPNWYQSVRTSSPNSYVWGSGSSVVVDDGSYVHVCAAPAPEGTSS